MQGRTRASLQERQGLEPLAGECQRERCPRMAKRAGPPSPCPCGRGWHAAESVACHRRFFWPATLRHPSVSLDDRAAQHSPCGTKAFVQVSRRIWPRTLWGSQSRKSAVGHFPYRWRSVISNPSRRLPGPNRASCRAGATHRYSSQRGVKRVR
ncbi:hypothetical protein BDW72DRAFT_26337 [Aspergillus terricola var. indicus]